MPTLSQLTSIEPQVEAALEAHFEARSVYQVLTRGEQAIAKTTRLDLGVTVGEAVSGAKVTIAWPDGTKSVEYGRRAIEVEAIWTTERARDIAAPGTLKLHDQGIAMIRAALMTKFLPELNARIPYHVLPFTLRELGCAYEIDDKLKCDRTIVRFGAFVDIRNDATTIAEDSGPS